MKIKYNGHSSFTITAADGTVIVTDPFEPGSFGGAIAYRAIPDRPHIVTVSHDHADHNYTRGFSGKFDVVRRSGAVRGIAFTAVPTFHDDQGGKLRGQNTVIVMEVDGVRVCHLGDLGHRLEPKHVAAIGHVDVLLVPIGGFFTIGPADAQDTVEKLDPRVVIPMHYKTASCAFDIASLGDFTKGRPGVVQTGKNEIELVHDRLPERTTIMVLEPAC